MKDSLNNQYGAVRNATGTPVDPAATVQNIHFANSTAGHLLKNSGGIQGYTSQTAVDVMNPYHTINYIIFTGRIL
jgi:hypothetical protein